MLVGGSRGGELNRGCEPARAVEDGVVDNVDDLLLADGEGVVEHVDGATGLDGFEESDGARHCDVSGDILTSRVWCGLFDRGLGR